MSFKRKTLLDWEKIRRQYGNPFHHRAILTKKDFSKRLDDIQGIKVWVFLEECVNVNNS